MTTSFPRPASSRPAIGPSASAELRQMAELRVASQQPPRVGEADDLSDIDSYAPGAAVVSAVSWSQAPISVEVTLAVALTASEPDS